MEHKQHGLLVLVVIIGLALWYIGRRVVQTSNPTDAYSGGYIPPNDPRRIDGSIPLVKSCSAVAGTITSPTSRGVTPGFSPSAAPTPFAPAVFQYVRQFFGVST